jgi:Domain found in Dishevelled, Egl-10, and Pleckstrin (DEP)
MPSQAALSRTSTTVLLGLASASAQNTMRAALMAHRLIPAELRPGPGSLGQLQRQLKNEPGSLAVLDLAALPDSVPHVLALAGALPEPAERARVLLTHERNGLWPSDQAWVLELGFAGLWAQLDAPALTGQNHTLIRCLAEKSGHTALAPATLAQYFSALRVSAAEASARGRIRQHTRLSPEALAAALATHVDINDRTYHMDTYVACFTGVEAVEWLSNHVRVSRALAVQMGQDLQALGLLQHVVHEQAFADLPNFYRITLSGAVDACNMGAIYRQMRQPTGLALQDRKYLGRTYAHCFIGSEAVDWVHAQLKLRRHEAEILLNRLLRLGLLTHVTHDHPVRDAHFFYRFVD